MGRRSVLVGGTVVAGALMLGAAVAGSQPREPCIPPGTYSPALGDENPVSAPAAESIRRAEGPTEGALITDGEEDVAAIDVVCVPIGTSVPPWSEAEMLPGPPTLAVVMTDLRPKDVHLILDGRDIGPARAFNGTNGFLFLEPGEYRLQAHLGGYEPVAFRIVARPRCRFDIRHRMPRIKGTPKERPAPMAAGDMLPRRVYGPRRTPEERPPGASSGPDLNLRPDLSGRSSGIFHKGMDNT